LISNHQEDKNIVIHDKMCGGKRKKEKNPWPKPFEMDKGSNQYNCT
jgi:hypothetical protein